MSSTDYEIEAHRNLAQYAYDLKQKYGMTYGNSRENFMQLYDAGEVALSTVFENLFVQVSKALGINVEKVSETGRDFSHNGDRKRGRLRKNGNKRRYTITSVANKIGTIYFVGWNWMTNTVEFHAIPKHIYGSPSQGIKIMRCTKTGVPTGGKYNSFRKDSFEDLVSS